MSNAQEIINDVLDQQRNRLLGMQEDLSAAQARVTNIETAISEQTTLVSDLEQGLEEFLASLNP